MAVPPPSTTVEEVFVVYQQCVRAGLRGEGRTAGRQAVVELGYTQQPETRDDDDDS